MAELEEGSDLNPEGWLDLGSLREVEFWVSHHSGDSAGLRLWLLGV